MYKVSVVTPFHNVDMNMFRKSAESMRQQTIGFENVEWIIVVHNCEPHYFPEVQEMFKNDKNVIVKELNNDAKTPSAPRNYGMKFVTAPYVGFLDGDDSYTPSCLEVVLREIQETQSQIVCFRREIEFEKIGLGRITEIVLWNQTIERIIIERDNWDDEKMFGTLWGLVTSKLYEVKMLRDKNLTFDEEVPLGEDFLHCIATFYASQRICYLPQFIGYHYFINGGSLVQNTKKSPEYIKKYAWGIARIIKAAQDCGIKSDYMLALLGMHLTSFIIGTADALTLEDRQYIKKVLGPYLCNARPLEVNKIFSEEEAEMSFALPQEVIMNAEDGISDYLLNLLNGQIRMKSILRVNQNTDYGQRYAFRQIQSIAGYQSRVPLSTYSDYEKLIRLQTNIGETGILTSEITDLYAKKKSGKILPMTREHLLPYADAFAKTLKRHNNLIIACCQPSGFNSGDNALVDSMESILLKGYIHQGYYSFGRKNAELTPSISLLFTERPELDYYTYMLKALSNRDIDQIVALTAGDILKAFRALEAHWQEMVETISKTDQERATQLQGIFEQGFEGIAGRLWTKLQRTIGFGAAEQEDNFKELQFYTKGTPHNHGYYITAETLMAVATDDDADTFKLITDNDVYEYMPIDAEENSRPLLLTETKIGERYQLIVTNRAGLYRYKTTHTLTILEKDINKGVIVTINGDTI